MHDDKVENVGSVEHIQHNGSVPISTFLICESHLSAFYCKYNKINDLKQNADKFKNYQWTFQNIIHNRHCKVSLYPRNWFIINNAWLWGTRWRSWSRHCATSWTVTGPIPIGDIGIFYWHNPSGRTMVLGLTQPLTEMITRNISWGVKAAGA